MKRELGWWTAFFVVAITVAGRMTKFEFRDIEIQLHDTYYVVPSWLAIVILFTILGLFRGVTKSIDRLSDKSRLMAIFVGIINGVVGLVLIILICVAIFNLIQVKKWYPDLDISTYIGIIVILISLLSLLTIIEIKTFKKLKTTKE